jgi:hypothetical protein
MKDKIYTGFNIYNIIYHRTYGWEEIAEAKFIVIEDENKKRN